MSYKIAVYGSAAGDYSMAVAKTRELGEALGKRNCVVITGACDGLPYAACVAAAAAGSNIWGFSPATDLATHQQVCPKQEIALYSKIFYVPKNFELITNMDACRKYRNVISTATCDAGIIMAGRWGTMNEFTNLYDMGKVIGVLTGTGNIADELEGWCKKISKESKAQIIYNDSPEHLVEQVIAALQTKKHL